MSFRYIVIIGSIVLGVIIFAVVLHSEKKKRKKLQMEFEELNESVRQDARKNDIELRIKQLKDTSDNIIDDMNETAENKLNTLSNKKIMEFEEYANQLFEKIYINHKEVMFLYDMLNSKEDSVKETIAQLQKLKVEMTELINDNASLFRERKNKKNIDSGMEEKDYHTDELKLNNYIEKDKMNNMISKDSSVEDIDIVASKDDFVDLLRCCKEYDLEEENNLEDDKSSVEFSLRDALDEQRHEKKDDNILDKSKEKHDNYQKRNEQIIKLYSLGYSTLEISKRLGIGTGEVALVNHLYS